MDFQTVTVNFTTSISNRVGNFLDAYIEADNPFARPPKLKKRAKGFCLNKRCSSKSELYRINEKHYRKNYSTDNYHIFDCPDCQHALYWTKKWELIEGYKDKKFNYKERYVSAT